MRAFVTGTGRCGTKTWARACSHLTSHTSGHETHRGRTSGYLDYPDRHIEVDPHLSFHLERLVDEYPSALFVHLWRPEDEVVGSWKRRGIKEHIGAAPLVDVMFQVDARHLTAPEYDSALRELYRSTTRRCDWVLSRSGCPFLSVDIYRAAEVWGDFCRMIDAEGDLEAGRVELGRRI